MLPLSDINPTRRTPVLTYLLILVNVLVFLWEQSLTDLELRRAFVTLAVVPANLIQDPFSLESGLDIGRSMFMHGGWAHLLGNMLYLWLFGDNVEDRCGRLFFLLFYFLSGAAAVMAQVLVSPTATIPLVGASGAIAGVLGAYLVLFPGVRVRGIIPIGFFFLFAEWPAWIVLFLWFVFQLFNGAMSLGVETMSGGVAFFAHVGGFVTGMLLTGLMMLVMPQPSAAVRRQMLYDRAQRRYYRRR